MRLPSHGIRTALSVTATLALLVAMVTAVAGSSLIPNAGTNVALLGSGPTAAVDETPIDNTTSPTTPTTPTTTSPTTPNLNTAETVSQQRNSPTTTGGVRPGWGCGDQNHTHSGPPGNPGATSPCDKGHGGAAGGAAANPASTGGRAKGH